MSSKLTYAIAAILGGFDRRCVCRRCGVRHRLAPGNYRHRAAPGAKHPRRAHHHAGFDGRDTSAVERVDLRRFRQVPAKRHGSEHRPGSERNFHPWIVDDPARHAGVRRRRQFPPRSRRISMTSPLPCPPAISTSMRQISSASKSWRALRAHYSGRGRNPGFCATSRTSRNSTRPRVMSTQGMPTPATAIPAATWMP